MSVKNIVMAPAKAPIKVKPQPSILAPFACSSGRFFESAGRNITEIIGIANIHLQSIFVTYPAATTPRAAENLNTATKIP